jgi:hypothetical protein
MTARRPSSHSARIAARSGLIEFSVAAIAFLLVSSASSCRALKRVGEGQAGKGVSHLWVKRVEAHGAHEMQQGVAAVTAEVPYPAGAVMNLGRVTCTPLPDFWAPS